MIRRSIAAMLMLLFGLTMPVAGVSMHFCMSLHSFTQCGCCEPEEASSSCCSEKPETKPSKDCCLDFTFPEAEEPLTIELPQPLPSAVAMPNEWQSSLRPSAFPPALLPTRGPPLDPGPSIQRMHSIWRL